MRPPPLVVRAHAEAARLGFERSCRDEEGALLHVLAGRRGILRAGEIGTGAGVGAAWIVSALEPATRSSPSRSIRSVRRVAAALFADDPDVRVLTGDWRELLPAEAPFDFLFVDGGGAKDDVDAVLELLAPRAPWCWTTSPSTPRCPTATRRLARHPAAQATEVWVDAGAARDRRGRRG